MRERQNPTDKQLLRRLNRPPVSDKDRRKARDAYWAVRNSGFRHAVAKHVYYDEIPKIRIESPDFDNEYLEGINPDDLLIGVDAQIVTLEVLMRPELDEETAKGAPPRRSEYTIWHQGLSGFGLRVRPTGYRTYILQCRVDGHTKQRKYTIGSPWMVTFDEALDIARTARIEASDGIVPHIRPRR